MEQSMEMTIKQENKDSHSPSISPASSSLRVANETNVTEQHTTVFDIETENATNPQFNNKEINEVTFVDINNDIDDNKDNESSDSTLSKSESEYLLHNVFNHRITKAKKSKFLPSTLTISHKNDSEESNIEFSDSASTIDCNPNLWQHVSDVSNASSNENINKIQHNIKINDNNNEELFQTEDVLNDNIEDEEKYTMREETATKSEMDNNTNISPVIQSITNDLQHETTQIKQSLTKLWKTFLIFMFILFIIIAIVIVLFQVYILKDNKTDTSSTATEESVLNGCSTSSVLGIAVTITFIIVYGLILIIVSLYSFIFLNKYDDKFMYASCPKKLRYWMIDVYKRRKCYIPIITHLADQITDIAVVIEFGQLAKTTNTKIQCGINMWYLFWLSIFVLIFYRAISSFFIYKSTKSVSRLFIQFMDLELFRTIYINYLCEKKEPSSPQRWITSFEAIFESTPQALIQSIYLIKTESFGKSPIVVASLLFSLWSITSKIISDDKVMCNKRAKSLALKPKKIKSFSCISYSYIARYLWRIFDVSSRILMTSLMWLLLGGVYLSIYIAFESFIILILCFSTKRLEFVFAIFTMVISKSETTSELLSNGLMIYRCIINTVIMSIITFMTYANRNKCWKCSSTVFNGEIFSIFVYCWIVTIIIPFLSTYMTLKIFVEDSSTSRTIDDMIKTKDWQGILEMQAYKTNYGVYNQKTEETLLMLAIQEGYAKLINHLSSSNRINWKHNTKKGHNILDYLFVHYNHEKNRYLGHLMDVIVEKNPSMKAVNGSNILDCMLQSIKRNDKHKKIMGKCLIELSKEHTDMRSRHGKYNLLEMAIYLGDIEIFKTLFDTQQFDTFRSWKLAVEFDRGNVIMYIMNAKDVKVPNYTKNWNLFAKQMIDDRKPNILEHLLKEHHEFVNVEMIWLYLARDGGLETLKVTQKFVKDVNVTNGIGRNALHIASVWDQRGIIEYLEKIIGTEKRDSLGYSSMELQSHSRRNSLYD